jgi:hypothetical protein
MHDVNDAVKIQGLIIYAPKMVTFLSATKSLRKKCRSHWQVLCEANIKYFALNPDLRYEVLKIFFIACQRVLSDERAIIR